jgi:hypothetical protein
MKDKLKIADMGKCQLGLLKNGKVAIKHQELQQFAHNRLLRQVATNRKCVPKNNIS